ncbi:PREDICTED: uncharacterized protein LOC104804656 [Tarenaya hassleriana]|uniref:uncharacterized protein LOC104804656 n=1 Tax=Tarenaya hassleriana TaxID=28532 RepID=UPI00053C1B75|nr:PREDICTED: uncharacterized protein LOC104804656 [Tarenaya hassleriana]
MKGTSKLVKDYLKEEYPGKLETPTASELVERVKSKYGLIVSYLMALRGKHSAEMVVIDATFLTWSYKGALVVATAQDGDHHQYHLAWDIIDREKDASWAWFMERLKDVIPDESDVVVLSDRHRSIIKVVREVYKEAGYGFCVRHIAQNIKVNVNKGVVRKFNRGESVASLFYKCAEAYTLNEFEERFNDLKVRFPKFAEYMQKEELDPEKWARAKFTRQRYNLLTTNGAESINSVLKKAKRFLLLGLLDICLGKTVEWFNRHRMEAGSTDDSHKVTPFIDKVLHERYEIACTYEVTVLNSFTDEFEVRDKMGS